MVAWEMSVQYYMLKNLSANVGSVATLELKSEGWAEPGDVSLPSSSGIL